MNIEKKTILLTGATGYLGSNLLKSLVYSYKCIIIIRNASSLSRISFIANLIHIYRKEQIDELFAEHKVDILIHTATNYGRRNESLTDLTEANLLFPLLLLDKCIQNNVPYFINTGSSLPDFKNRYSLSKANFRDWLKINESQITTVHIKLEHFYGPGDDPSKFIPFLIKKMRDNEESVLLTTGEQERDFIYIDDLVEAYLVLLKNISIFSKFTQLDIGSGSIISIKQLALFIKNIIGSKTELKFGAIETPCEELMKSIADIKILNSLGWEPRTNLAQGLLNTIATF